MIPHLNDPVLGFNPNIGCQTMSYIGLVIDNGKVKWIFYLGYFFYPLMESYGTVLPLCIARADPFPVRISY